jgi:predicted dehydrogenase
MEIPYSSWTWSFKNEAKHFIECIKESRIPRSDGKDSLKDMIIMEEIYRSFLERKGCKLNF